MVRIVVDNMHTISMFRASSGIDCCTYKYAHKQCSSQASQAAVPSTVQPCSGCAHAQTTPPPVLRARRAQAAPAQTPCLHNAQPAYSQLTALTAPCLYKRVQPANSTGTSMMHAFETRCRCWCRAGCRCCGRGDRVPVLGSSFVFEVGTP